MMQSYANSSSRTSFVAAARGANVALFGHTHIPVAEERGGVFLFNPGSCGRCYTGPNTYGILTLALVGPRPHMLKHTEEYSKLINKYMVRHFVKPGITGWSQVTGYRGETKELKDMEGRIRGDIWYIEHWSFGLDLYIIYKTVANAVHGEKNAY